MTDLAALLDTAEAIVNERLAALGIVIDVKDRREGREIRSGSSGGFVTPRQRRWFFAAHGGSSGGGTSTGPVKVKKSELDRDENEFRHYADNDDAEVHGVFQPEYRKWSDDLSIDEVAAIKAYTDGGYDKINGSLRGGLDPGSGPSTAIKTNVLELDKAIAKAPGLQEDTILYRGFGSYDLKTKVNNGQLKKGAVLTDRGFMSTSPQGLEARSFSFSSDDPVIYKIRARKGARGAYLGFDHINAGHSNEAEYLLPRNAKLVVVNAEMKSHGGTRYAEIEVAYMAD